MRRMITSSKSIDFELKEILTWISMVSKLAELCTRIHILPYGPFEDRPHFALLGQCIEVQQHIHACFEYAYDYGDEWREYLRDSKGAKYDRKQVKSSILVLSDMLQHTTADNYKDKDCIETMRSLTKRALSTIYNSRNW